MCKVDSRVGKDVLGNVLRQHAGVLHNRKSKTIVYQD